MENILDIGLIEGSHVNARPALKAGKTPKTNSLRPN